MTMGGCWQLESALTVFFVAIAVVVDADGRPSVAPTAPDGDGVLGGLKFGVQFTAPNGGGCLSQAAGPPREGGGLVVAPCSAAALPAGAPLDPRLRTPARGNGVRGGGLNPHSAPLPAGVVMAEEGPAAGSVWVDGPDVLGNPQIALVSSKLELCLNDYSVLCTPGNRLLLHQCQLGGIHAHLNTANHFTFTNGTLRADFCSGPAMCVAATAADTGGDRQDVTLGLCTGGGAVGWGRVKVQLPPTPPPPPPIPPIPPAPPIPPGPLCKDCPNIVFVLTDDQDVVLGGGLPATSAGGATPLPRAKALLMDQGVVAENFFIHTPVCCPSRSETLTGRYLHNVKLPVAEKQCGGGYAGTDAFGNVCCMHVDEALVNNNTMANYLQKQAGYRVGMFGKYLNNCPADMQPGFDAWFANGGGSYYAPQFATKNIGGLPDGGVTFNKTQYSTALIGNYSLDWIRKVATDGTGLPWMAYIGTKACHDPFQPSPWYTDAWDPTWPAAAPRPPSYNVSMATLASHHPTISSRPPFSNSTATCIDTYFKDRWRTLMSVDDIISSVHQLVDDLGQTNTTYFIYTSDHGYSLGELNLNWDKRNVYDFDVRIHLVIRGPGIVPGSTFSELSSNVDLAPTMLSMAGLPRPATMDGRSLLPLLVDTNSTAAARLPGSVRRYLASVPPRSTVQATWRQSHFIEYYYVGIGGDCGMAPIELPDNNFIAIRVVNSTHNLLYAEFQSGVDGNVGFDAIEHHELFDMTTDPWQMQNVYNQTDGAVTSEFHRQVQSWLRCKGSSCP